MDRLFALAGLNSTRTSYAVIESRLIIIGVYFVGVVLIGVAAAKFSGKNA